MTRIARRMTSPGRKKATKKARPPATNEIRGEHFITDGESDEWAKLILCLETGRCWPLCATNKGTFFPSLHSRYIRVLFFFLAMWKVTPRVTIVVALHSCKYGNFASWIIVIFKIKKRRCGDIPPISFSFKAIMVSVIIAWCENSVVARLVPLVFVPHSIGWLPRGVAIMAAIAASITEFRPPKMASGGDQRGLSVSIGRSSH